METALIEKIKWFFQKKWNNKYFFGILLILALGVFNTLFYSNMYYTQNGLKENLLNTISINWGIVLDFCTIVMVIFLAIKITLLQKIVDNSIKASVESEDNTVRVNRDLQDLIIRKFNSIESGGISEKK